MITFSNFYILLTEAGRPNIIIPSIIGDENTKRYETILNRITRFLKDGKDSEGNELYDSKGDIAYGITDSTIQERKIRYFIFHLLQMGDKLDPNSPTFEDDYRNLLTKARDMSDDILIIKNKFKGQTRGAKFTTAIALLIKDNLEHFKSSKFTNDLFNNKNLADYLNSTRVVNHPHSIRAAKKREESHGLGIADVHNILSASRDTNTIKNRRAGYDRMKERNRNPPDEI